MFSREKRRQRIAELRRAYGDLCWRCGGKLSFHPLATRRRATIEHLLAKKAGGTSAWENVRLCHPRCNGFLGTETPDQKRRMRTDVARRTVPDFAARPGPLAPPPPTAIMPYLDLTLTLEHCQVRLKLVTKRFIRMRIREEDADHWSPFRCRTKREYRSNL